MIILTIIAIIIALLAQLVFGIKIIDFIFKHTSLFITVAAVVILLRVLFMVLPAIMSLVLSVTIAIVITNLVIKVITK